MAYLRLFGPARQAARGVTRTEIAGRTVAEILREAEHRFGEPFTEVLAVSRIWVNGEPVAVDAEVSDRDEVAVLPPVSGG
jgi:molybdopterin converting factor small subunit